MSRDHYTYRVTWSPEDNEYVAICTMFPSLSWLAATRKDALDGIRNVVAAVVADRDTDILRELWQAGKSRGPAKPIDFAQTRTEARQRLDSAAEHPKGP